MASIALEAGVAVAEEDFLTVVFLEVEEEVLAVVFLVGSSTKTTTSVVGLASAPVEVVV